MNNTGTNKGSIIN